MWQTPPEPIASQLDVPSNPGLLLSLDSQWVVELERPLRPSLVALSEPTVGVAGIQLNPLTREPAQAYAYRSMTVRRTHSGAQGSLPQRVTLPEDARIRNLLWSPDSRYLSFTLTQAEGVALWVLDLEQNRARQITGPVLNAVYGKPCDWLPNDEGLICKVVPDGQGAPPERPPVPNGPRIEENLGQEAPVRTYTNLLGSPHDEALFEYYMTSTLERITLDGSRQPLTGPLLIDEATPSPDGDWILLETIHRPFSFRVPAHRFPKRLTVLDGLGETAYRIADLPLAEDIPLARGSVRPGRRWASWRSDRPATLYWVEAKDGGDARQDVEVRDVVYQIAAPFDQTPDLLWQTAFRFNSVLWGTDDLALGFDVWPDTKQVRTWQLNPSQPNTAPILLAERDWQDAYSHPGYPVTAPGDYGWRTLLIADDDHSIFLNGEGSSPDGVYPFLDRWNLATGETERLWQAEAPYYETIWEVLDNQARQIITQRQSRFEPSRLLLRNLQTSQVVPIVAQADRLPWYADVTQTMIHYEREDGVQLSGTLYLPPGHQAADAPLPTLLWIYPEEFESPETAGQITRSENQFSRPYGASPLFLLTQGYAILSYPSMPIVGSEDLEPNDTYVEQLLLNAQAARDYLTDSGISDPDRIAVGGHSYGAFTAANLLAHSDLFCAGIARSGAYNRSLTPFGFQGEARHFWEAQETYIKLSPFMTAAAITEPLLLIHGAEDDNTGTYPLQSERLYEALRGLGGTVRWVELPLEGHGYRSREAVGHVLWEMSQWMTHCAPETASEEQ